MKKSFHIAVEGSIGVGKTSLAKILSNKLQCKLVLEEFEENPFLSEFYSDKSRYAFQTQLFFLLSRYRQQIEFQQVDIFAKSIISCFVSLVIALISLEKYFGVGPGNYGYNWDIAFQNYNIQFLLNKFTHIFIY